MLLPSPRRNPTTYLEAKQSKKAEIVNYYYQWQILKPSRKKGQRRASQFL
jgi:hypothetical protein